MTRTAGAAPTEPVTAVCAAMYAADLVPAYAFVFRVAATGTRFTLYAQTQDRYHIGEEYTLLLVPGDTVSLPLTMDDVEFVRHCLDNAARRWREAITEAAAAANQRQAPDSTPPDHVNVEPTPAGYRAARRLFADELDRVERLRRVLDRHLDTARPATRDGGQS